MYGLAYCKLDYYYMMDMDLVILGRLLRSEIDKEVHQYDLEMQKISWQTACLMNATGNYKTPVKPEKLYIPLDKQKKKNKPEKMEDVQAKREELLKTFGIKA
ncbi:hypothetical protein LAV60_15350 [Clostridium sporogenes]|uniref:hypothetical protein n=1 Tax=Clostridium sporogenes TaxID=1509 RepID=UPI002237AB5C|nr:hypothetical protein [Clostridium sporogenes]MCW6094546.1 hypothetical protein [Clostridium sporogenes]